MSSKDFQFDHVGIAVKSLKEGAAAYAALGFGAGRAEVMPTEKVRVQMYELANQCRVELLEPTGPESVITRFLEKHGPGIHHICFRVKNLTAKLEELKKNGVKLVHETPVKGAGGCKVAFIHPHSSGGVLIELSEKVDS